MANLPSISRWVIVEPDELFRNQPHPLWSLNIRHKSRPFCAASGVTLDWLSKQHRQCILRCTEGLQSGEIADVLGVRKSILKKSLRRSMQDQVNAVV